MCGEGPSLLGRDWLGVRKLKWPRIKLLSSHYERLEVTLQKHTQRFEEGLGNLQGVKAKIHVDPTATPIFPQSKTGAIYSQGETRSRETRKGRDY